jgi:tRNA pseudouridine65 synthase
MNTTLDVIFQDQHMVAINKPSGLLVHRSNIDRHETQFALQLLRDQLNQHVFPVHRLDKPTSGILLFALSNPVARQLTEAFTNGEISKTYLAIVRGYCPEKITIDHPLKHQYDKMTDGRSQKNKPPQQAITHCRRLATIELPFAVDRYPQSRYSLVEAKPETGRKHQIRRHFKHIAHPIIGDPKYGKSTHNHFFSEQLGLSGLLLLAHKIMLKHPVTDEKINISAAVSKKLERAFEQFNWEI